MDGRKQAARKRFDGWAPSYGRDRRSRFNAGPQRAALEALRLERGDRLLDVGCGIGTAVREAAATVERAVGVDLSPAMVEHARELAAGSARIEFVVGDSEALPFPARAFTALLCSASFHHYPDPGRALAEMARVLEPGGRLAIADGSADLLAARVADRLLRRLDASHVRLYRSAELAGLVAAHGFEDVAAVRLRSSGFMLLTARRAADPGMAGVTP